MSDLFSLERVHQSRVEMLIELFGREDMKDIYEREKQKLESGAKVETFIPMLAYRKVLELMEK